MLCRMCDKEVELKDIKPTLVCPLCLKTLIAKLNRCQKSCCLRNSAVTPKLSVKQFNPHQSAE